MWKKTAGAEVSKKDIEDLLEKGVTEKVFSMKSKSGSSFKAKFKFSKRTGKVEFLFQKMEYTGNRPLSPKQQEIIKREADEETLKALDEERYDECRRWLDNYFKKS